MLRLRRSLFIALALLPLVALSSTPLPLDGQDAEDIARLSGRRYEAMAWVADLFVEGLVTAEDPAPEEGLPCRTNSWRSSATYSTGA